MTRLRTAIRKAVAVLLPWPLRHERRAAIQAAKGEKETSQRGAEDAAAIEQQIEQMAAENHFAASIARQITARHRGDTG